MDSVAVITGGGGGIGLAIQNASFYLELQGDVKDLKDEIWSHRAYF